MVYNDPEIAFITAFASEVKTVTGFDVFEIEPDDPSFPYIYSQINITNTSNKREYYYDLDVSLQIIDRDAESLSQIVTAKNSLTALVNKGSAFDVDGFKIIKSDIANTNRVEREINDHKYNVQIIRIIYELQKL